MDPKSGVFQALTSGSVLLGIGFFAIVASIFNVFGSAGGIGTTVAGVSRIPFVVGIDRYLPSAFGKIHPKWKTPWVSILVQAGISCAILLLIQINESANSAYQILVDAGTVLYFIPFVYIYAAFIKLSYRSDRASEADAVLVPGGKAGVWIAGLLGCSLWAWASCFRLFRRRSRRINGCSRRSWSAGTFGGILLGLMLYFRGARQKRRGGGSGERSPKRCAGEGRCESVYVYLIAKSAESMLAADQDAWARQHDGLDLCSPSWYESAGVTQN